MLTYQVLHCDEPPPLAGEVPQCAHWGGEGVRSADPLHRFARLMRLHFPSCLRQHRATEAKHPHAVDVWMLINQIVFTRGQPTSCGAFVPDQWHVQEPRFCQSAQRHRAQAVTGPSKAFHRENYSKFHF